VNTVQLLFANLNGLLGIDASLDPNEMALGKEFLSQRRFGDAHYVRQRSRGFPRIGHLPRVRINGIHLHLHGELLPVSIRNHASPGGQSDASLVLFIRELTKLVLSHHTEIKRTFGHRGECQGQRQNQDA
jgi:hypothetical protein